MKIYIGNLPQSVTEEEIWRTFGMFSVPVRVVKIWEAGSRRVGYAFADVALAAQSGNGMVNIHAIEIWKNWDIYVPPEEIYGTCAICGKSQQQMLDNICIPCVYRRCDGCGNRLNERERKKRLCKLCLD